ncbi:hypothetical protein O0880_14190 [Janthinobacterium sp. SUN118]|uniref:hypothetical protein n=1 Tax=Janthinobacterium sp. SUN118 TaxID=3004100 RepID=UPI0025B151ED|nr:hypothetical protein [Janthinobacterium sp. SUN118]MDN2710572.1 hypothetical protein [Janthinobacterium sp. SUN118]
MRISISECISALGGAEDGIYFKQLRSFFSDVPEVTEDLSSDDIGKTRYYQFRKSGVEFGFRGGSLNHIHFYFLGNEEYSAYKGYLDDLGSESDENFVFEKLGCPLEFGAARKDLLLGEIRKWVRYDKDSFAIHIEFSNDNHIAQMSIFRT